jgi:hypothetical protein
MRHSVAYCASAIWLGLAASAHAQSRLPAELDDGAFWSLIGELSEPDGFFSDENYVSNELGLQRLLPVLEQTFEPGGVFIGVGPEQNFSYVAALQPRIAFVVDIRRQNAMEHLMYKALFELADSRADFVSLLFSRPKPPALDADTPTSGLLAAFRAIPADPALYEATLGSILDVLVARHGFALGDADRASVTKVFTAFYDEGLEIHYIFRGTDEDHPNYVQVMDLTDASGTNWSYLGSEERFQRVKRMQLANRIVPVVGDFAGGKTLRAIGDYVRRHGDTIDVFYTSNVEQYLFTDNLWRPFYDNVATLPVSESAIFVRTFFGSLSRQCSNPRTPIRTPLTSSIAELLDAYRRGEIETQCALAEWSR